MLAERTRMALPEKGMICLDTGCVFGRRLTAMVVEDGSFWLDSVERTGKQPDGKEQEAE